MNRDLIEIFNNKKYKVDKLDTEGEYNNCGDSVSMRIVDGKMKWSGDGCLLTTCAAEIACERFDNGKKDISIDIFLLEVLQDPPVGRMSCFQIVIDAFNKAMKNE